MAADSETPTRKAPQRPIGVPEELWKDCMAIAKALAEKDDIGRGVPVVVRRSLARYRSRHRHLLDKQPNGADESSAS